jgi:hypothetical protein
VHATTKDKSDDMKDSFYGELECVVNQFPKYHMKILLGDFNATVGTEDIFKQTIRNESLHEIRNDNGVTAVNFATPENLTVKNTMLPQHKIHKCIWSSPDGKTHNHQTGHILMDKRQTSNIVDV